MEPNEIYKKAVYLEQTKQEEAFSYYLQAAKAGHEKSMSCVAYYYAKKQEYALAFDWYLILAKKSNVNAMYLVGLYYKWGRGTKKDYKASLYWLNQVENMNAWYQLADSYEKGFGVPPSPSLSIKYYLKAAKAGHVQAMYELARMYRQESEYWLEQAEKNNTNEQ